MQTFQSSVLVQVNERTQIVKTQVRAPNYADARWLLWAAEPEANAAASPLPTSAKTEPVTHIGGSTLEAQAYIGLEVAEKFVRYSDTGSALSAVNFPEVGLPLFGGRPRLLHIHKNLPGVLSAINRLFAGHGVNVSAQTLMTNAEIGYLVMDIGADYSHLTWIKLNKIEGTIRTRMNNVKDYRVRELSYTP